MDKADKEFTKARKFYCDFNSIDLGDVGYADNNNIHCMRQYAQQVSMEKQETFDKIGELLEKDIPEQKFILALIQIKKWVQPYYEKSTGIWG